MRCRQQWLKLGLTAGCEGFFCVMETFCGHCFFIMTAQVWMDARGQTKFDDAAPVA